MLQRSPSYLVSVPGRDPLAAAARSVLPPRAAHAAVRAKNIAVNVATYQLARRFPRATRRVLLRGVARHLPDGFDVATHFTPRYAPWDERLCVVPDADLFTALSTGRAEVVTDTVERFVPDGVELSSGRMLPADLVVTATGLTIQAVGGIDLVVDGRPVSVADTHVYKGLMLSGVPNLAWCVGYPNNSWTLRADLTATYVCRLLAHLAEHGWTTATPRFDGVGDAAGERPLLDLRSGYLRRAADVLPRQGERRPWRLRQNYLVDLIEMHAGRVDDGRLELTRAPRPGRPPASRRAEPGAGPGGGPDGPGADTRPPSRDGAGVAPSRTTT